MSNTKTWYFGPTSDLEMCGGPEGTPWVWIADNPDGLLDDSHITDLIEDILPEKFDEQCESIFSYEVQNAQLTYADARAALIAAGFVESRLNDGVNAGRNWRLGYDAEDDDDAEDDNGDEDTTDAEHESPLVKLENTPETLEAAIARIQALEQALDNVCYGLEISEFTGKYDHVKPFVQEAFALLETRIPHQDQDVKAETPVTIYEGKASLSEEQVKKLVDQDK